MYVWLAVLTGGLVYAVRYFLRTQSSPAGTHQTLEQAWNYHKLVTFIKENKISLPAMLIDETVLNENIDFIIRTVARSGKTVRIATKSIRCVKILKHIIGRGRSLGVENIFKGFMCFSVNEAKYLSDEGFDDFYIAYPTLQKSDIETALMLVKGGKNICVTVDSIECVEAIEETLTSILSETEDDRHLRLPVAIDLDMSFTINVQNWPLFSLFFNQPIKLGAHRSRIDNIVKFSKLVSAIQSSEHLHLSGIMGYEAHVAGLPDMRESTGAIPGFVVRFLKRLFYEQSVAYRKTITRWCQDNAISVQFFNGSGSGNFEEAVHDPALTEVAVGSAFLQGQIFDNFASNKCLPAMCFGLQVHVDRLNRSVKLVHGSSIVIDIFINGLSGMCMGLKKIFLTQITRRNVSEQHVTCQSGGFIASGGVSADKCPAPFRNPTTLSPVPGEGYGEVQTPLKTVKAHMYELGDPLFFRPAKSGEIAEQFEEYIVKKGYEVSYRAVTYRGARHRFF